MNRIEKLIAKYAAILFVSEFIYASPTLRGFYRSLNASSVERELERFSKHLTKEKQMPGFFPEQNR